MSKKKKEKYFIPDMGTDKPIEVSKEIYDAYNFLMTELEKMDDIKKTSPSKQHKDENKKDGNGKR